VSVRQLWYLPHFQYERRAIWDCFSIRGNRYIIASVLELCKSRYVSMRAVRYVIVSVLQLWDISLCQYDSWAKFNCVSMTAENNMIVSFWHNHIWHSCHNDTYVSNMLSDMLSCQYESWATCNFVSMTVELYISVSVWQMNDIWWCVNDRCAIYDCVSMTVVRYVIVSVWQISNILLCQYDSWEI
jgi:hypothetical protein